MTWIFDLCCLVFHQKHRVPTNLFYTWCKKCEALR